ncbi:unnamed protein product [Symbiodinium necroappetens]|uniref:Mitochondrial cardiolipin hydrolase n=1 Tax=Symbiodinium necroappetens TaxID=1628268 RepID=A0A812ZZH4_9DINO|nr:unnamed protein product [Symbiodinium necroappetens]
MSPLDPPWSASPLCHTAGFWGTSWCLLQKTCGLVADVSVFALGRTIISESLLERLPEEFRPFFASLRDKAQLFFNDEHRAEIGFASAAWLSAVVLFIWHILHHLRQRYWRCPEVLFFPDKSGTHVRHICLLLRAARRKVWVAMFALTDDVLAGELLSAFRRGVDVKVIVDDEQCGMLGADAPKLLEAGVPVLIDSSPARMHHKIAIVDECVLTGSFNWTKQASTTNWENLCILRDPAVVAAFANEFQALWREFATRSQEMPGRPPPQKKMEEGLEQLAEVRKQLKESSARIDGLRDLHREWQGTVESLLERVDTAFKNHENALELQLRELPDEPRESRRRRSITERDVGGATSDRGNKAVALHPLLKSRKSVLQHAPAGPLRKLLIELLPHSEANGAVMDSPISKAREMCARLVASSLFEFFSGFVILLNLVAIGVEAEMSLQDEMSQHSLWFSSIESIFLGIYCLEAGLQLFGRGCAVLQDLWFWMDVCLIAIGLLALWVVPAIVGGEDTSGFEKLLVVRGVRLLRLVRVLRMVRHFKIMWRLVYGLLTASQTILSTTALILVSLFIFACVAVELIAKDADLLEDTSTRDIVIGRFRGVGKAILTLTQFVTLDGLSDVWFPLIVKKPWLWTYFLPILDAIQQRLGSPERAMLKRKVRGALPVLIGIFQTIDTDHSGLITREEVSHVPIDILPPRVLEAVCVDNMEDIFDLLDVDDSGFLTQMEFVEGLLNLSLLDMPMWTLQNLRLLKLVNSRVSNIEQCCEWLVQSLPYGSYVERDVVSM